VRAGWRKHRQIVRGDDFRVAYGITQLAASCTHAHDIADADISERTEKPISMPRNRAVARLPRMRSVSEMSGSSQQSSFIVAVNDRRG
jgi:hypothetical protein